MHYISDDAHTPNMLIISDECTHTCLQAHTNTEQLEGTLKTSSPQYLLGCTTESVAEQMTAPQENSKQDF